MVHNVYMIRKQIYLTPQIDEALIIHARQNGQSVAEVIREALTKSLKIKAKQKSAADVLLQIAGTGKGPRDLSAHLFDYLYGDKSPNYGKRKKVIRRR